MLIDIAKVMWYIVATVAMIILSILTVVILGHYSFKLLSYILYGA